MTATLADLGACWRAGDACRSTAGRHYGWAGDAEVHADATGTQHVAVLADPTLSSTIYRIAEVTR